MLKFTFAILFLVLSATAAKSQSIDSLQLTAEEIPVGYRQSEKLLCATPHASSFYTQSNLYETFLGKITRKNFQSFEKKGDTGSILYFEFEKAFEATDFLNGLLWGNGTKPSKSEPDEYFIKGKLLIVWSFNLKSELKQISKAKVINLLK